MAFPEETAEETAQFEAMMREEAAPPAPAAPVQAEQEQDAPAAEAAPEAAPAAEKPAVAPAPEKPAEKPVRLVPHQALHEERERRRQLERRLAELEARVAPPPSPDDEAPDENQDPIGALRYLKAQIARDREAREQAQQQQAALAELASRVQSRVTAYAAEHPEYGDQVQYLREFRFRELTEGLNMPPELAARQVQSEEIALGKMAVDQDLDPGEMVAKLASVRGWKPKGAEKPAPAPAAEQQIERLAAGRRAAVSPSAAGGSGPEPAMTVEQLLALDGAAFDKAFAKHGKRLFGG